MQTMATLTKAGIWCVTMKDAASLSNLSCSFVDLLSAGGKDTPEHKAPEACHIVFLQKIWLCVCLST